jgi:hypothetical protein
MAQVCNGLGVEHALASLDRQTVLTEPMKNSANVL